MESSNRAFLNIIYRVYDWVREWFHNDVASAKF